MEGRNGQLVDEDVMETASVAPPEPRKEENGQKERQQGQGDSGHSDRDQNQAEPIIRPSPD